MYNNDRFNELFHNPTKSLLIDSKFISIFNNEGPVAAIQYLVSIGATRLDIDNYEITYVINECTKDTTDPEKIKELLTSLEKRLGHYVISAKKGYNPKKQIDEIVITTTEGEVRVIEFSSLVPEIKRYMPSIANGSREGKCFELVFEFCKRFNVNIPYQVVTGFIYGYSDKSEYLHSWIELEYNGEEYVIDCTLNAMINKEGYYLTQHADPISKHSNEVISQDFFENYEVVKRTPFEIYLVYRNELVGQSESEDRKLQLTPETKIE